MAGCSTRAQGIDMVEPAALMWRVCGWTRLPCSSTSTLRGSTGKKFDVDQFFSFTLSHVAEATLLVCRYQSSDTGVGFCFCTQACVHAFVCV